jgi:deoxyribonuclease-4
VDAAGDEALARAGLPVYVHAPYLVNLGSGDPGTAARSAEAVRHELDRAARLGARGVVVHAGSASRWDRDGAREWALRQVGDLLLIRHPLLADVPFAAETPKASQGGDVATLRRLRDGDPRG